VRTSLELPPPRSALLVTRILALVLLFVAPSVSACKTEEVTAPGFSEETFLAIPLGATEAEVVSRLGEPLERWNRWSPSGTWDASYWSYRKRGGSGSAFHAVLIFSPQGRLTDRNLEFYLD
jgi:hypothetical protein